MVSKDSILRPKESLSVMDLEHELLVSTEGRSKVHVLNRTAREVFLRLDGEVSLAALAEEFGTRYRKDVLADVLSVATSLESLELVELMAAR